MYKISQMQIDIPNHSPAASLAAILFNCNNLNLRNTIEIEKDNSLVHILNYPNIKGKVLIKSKKGQLGKHEGKGSIPRECNVVRPSWRKQFHSSNQIKILKTVLIISIS